MNDSVLSNMFLKPFRLESIMMLFLRLVLESSSDQTELDLPTDTLLPAELWLMLDRLKERAELFRRHVAAAS